MKTILNLWRLMRPHQWLKNSFVFTGLLFGHAWHDGHLVLQVVLAALAFSLMSSAVYIINDMVDCGQDRLHPEKCLRPLAANQLGMSTAGVFAALLMLIALLLAGWVAAMVLVIIVLYALMNLSYSLRLKHVVILDVFIIAAGFMLRILAGTLGVGIPPSQWLLLCGLMVTLFLGFAKRRAEIIELAETKTAHRKVLAHYSPVLLDKMIGITASGVIMSYSLYTMSPDTVHTHGTSNLIYTVPFVMYGVFRYIYLLHQQHGGGDPSRDVVRDPHMLLAVLAWGAATFWLIR
ncbi:decaprenyl-phosphate phosphoribosyltransferase [Sulfuriferula sp. AH1]|uniref:decaprenyl-phosphate phosphoribosyltransferase n=1 Tax=Sulfuriferula sp. AH1 TaxID=1985873 RepID=UPI000B3B120A|nr:decaprenyl-phosphate phosphoribosyltransferase [Sulfuriferula sp. AH1]ARU32432.1 decaprenyl-phosphate phosphoribosyltransferase [Sulfuriferula sp. AH1]